MGFGEETRRVVTFSRTVVSFGAEVEEVDSVRDEDGGVVVVAVV